MTQKRPSSDQYGQPFSCESCYKRKLKCNRGNPCLHCARLSIECVPVETSNKRRKQRFPEAELLARIKRYEKVLFAYGVDISAIKDEDASPNNDSTSSPSQLTRPYSSNSVPVGTSSRRRSDAIVEAKSADQGDLHRLLNIIEGEETKYSSNRVEQVFYGRFFQDDGSSLFAATELNETPLHPAPFDIFKLWQTYCDNVHPLCKILHGPTFQRKISSHGSHLYLAPAADQALFFGMYLAAILSLSPEECQLHFETSKEALQKQYQHSAQVWLRRAGYWTTSDLTTLQAFVLFLYTQQHVVDPRALVSFTGMADRLARRMGLHLDKHSQGSTLVEQEIRKRVWWELLFLDARTIERAGMGNLDLKGSWSTPSLDERSDTDLEYQQSITSIPSLQPSSEMIFVLLRSEAAQCQNNISNLSAEVPIAYKLQAIDELQTRIQGRYLAFCNDSLPQHRLAKLFSRMTVSRMVISAYLLEEASQDESHQASIRQHLLENCVSNLEDFTTLREDPAMQRFMWFLYHYMPAYVYIHLLRLLQIQVGGKLVDDAWRVLEIFRSQGASLPVDMLVLRAWKARQAAAVKTTTCVEVPKFVEDILLASGQKEADMNPSSDALKYSDSTSLQPEYMVTLAEIMAGNTEYDFDWSTWLS